MCNRIKHSGINQNTELTKKKRNQKYKGTQLKDPECLCVKWLFSISVQEIKNVKIFHLNM